MGWSAQVWPLGLLEHVQRFRDSMHGRGAKRKIASKQGDDLLEDRPSAVSRFLSAMAGVNSHFRATGAA